MSGWGKELATGGAGVTLPRIAEKPLREGPQLAQVLVGITVPANIVLAQMSKMAGKLPGALALGHQVIISWGL